MDWDIDARLLLVSVQDVVDLLYRFVVAGVGATQDHENTNGVLVNVLLDQLRIQAVRRVFRYRQNSCLNLEVAGKLLLVRI